MIGQLPVRPASGFSDPAAHLDLFGGFARARPSHRGPVGSLDDLVVVLPAVGADKFGTPIRWPDGDLVPGHRTTQILVRVRDHQRFLQEPAKNPVKINFDDGAGGGDLCPHDDGGVG